MPSHDVMPNMDLYQPVQVEDALALAHRLAERRWLVGVVQYTYGCLKDRAKPADGMIAVSGVDSSAICFCSVLRFFAYFIFIHYFIRHTAHLT